MKKNHLITILGGITIAITALVPNIAMAWGPERPTYTNEHPADYATFNSITDNVSVGDERNFVRVREIGANTTYKDTVKVTPGKEYEVYIYFHNDAGSDTNASGLGVATGTKVASTYPTYLSKTKSGTITGTVSWSYVTSASSAAQMGKVWDEATLETDYDDVVMRFKPASAIIHNGGSANGMVLPSNLFAEGGTLIGYNKLGGVIPGCAEYSGNITYTLVAEKIDSTLSKKVSLDGKTWSENVTVKPGEYVTYKVEFKNTGNTTLTNVIMKDTHDDGLTLRSGSVKIFDADHTEGLVIDDILDISGYNFGDAGVSALRQIIYQAKVAEDETLCGKTLKNTIAVRYNSADQKSDDASVKVQCDEKPKPTCEEDPTQEGCEKPKPTCEEDPTQEGCEKPKPTCEEDPTQEGCKKPEEPEKTCKTNPEMEGCQKIPSTGPLEIVMAVIIVLGIGGGGYYLYRSKKNLNKIEKKAKGKEDEPKIDSKPEEPVQIAEKDVK